MHLHHVRVVARPKDLPRPAKVVSKNFAASSMRSCSSRPVARRAFSRDASSGSPRGLPRKNDEPRLRLFVRMWRNWHTHRPQKPAVARP